MERHAQEPPPATPSGPQQQTAISASTQKNPGTGKTIAVILLLILFYPLGVILMAIWMKWHVGIKIAVAIVLPFILLMFLGIFSAILVAVIDPFEQIRKANIVTCQNKCEATAKDDCVAACIKKFPRIKR